MNENGPQLHLFRTPDGANKARLVIALNLLWRLCLNQKIAARRIGCTERTFRRALEGQKTEIKLRDVQKAAAKHAEIWREEVDGYEWAAITRMVKMIDPAAEVAYIAPQKLPAKIEAHMRENTFAALSHTFHHFKHKGVKPTIIRQAMRRIIAKHPELAEREYEIPVGARPDIVDELMVLVNPEESAPQEPVTIKMKKADVTLGGKPQGVATDVVITITPEPVAPKKKPATRKAPVTQPPAPVKSQDEIIKETGQNLRKKVEEIMKPIVEAAEPTLFERIAMQREAGIGPSKAVEDRLAKLLKQGGQ